MEIQKKNSVISIYLVGVTWVLFALFADLYLLRHFLIVIGISVVVYFVSALILPKEVIEKQKDPFDMTKDERLNQLIKEANEFLRQIREADEDIPGTVTSEKIVRIEEASKKIFTYIVEHKDQMSEIRRFMNYYLPTTLKLLGSYAQLDQQDSDGEHISATKARINEMLDTVGEAFEKLLDELFEVKSMDIDADITVFESILSQEGLIGEDLDDFMKKSKGE